MPEYPMDPLRIFRGGYRGQDPRKQEKIRTKAEYARQLAEHVNKVFSESGQNRRQFLYGFLAVDTGIPIEVLQEFCIDGGHNGFSVWLPPTNTDAR